MLLPMTNHYYFPIDQSLINIIPNHYCFPLISSDLNDQPLTTIV